MIIKALVPPRADGTLRVTAPDGNTYVFLKNQNGDLCCEVESQKIARWMLATGNFDLYEQMHHKRKSMKD